MRKEHYDACCELLPADRETIYWQLGFIAATIGNAPQGEYSVNDYCGLMTIVNEIADKIFPEGKADMR